MPNPGRFTDVFRESNAILQPKEFFEGFKMDYERKISAPFSVSHGVHLGAQAEVNGYAFTALLQPSPTLFCLVRHESAGNSIAMLNALIGKRLMLQFHAQDIPQQPANSALSVEAVYTGSDFTATAKASTGSIALTYLQSITKRWALGLECQYLPNNAASIMSLAARYANQTQDKIFALQANLMGQAIMTFTSKMHPAITVSNELMLSKEGNRINSSYAIGCELRSTDFGFAAGSMKARFDTNKKLTVVYEERLGAVGCTLCTEFDNVKDELRFGVGLQFTI